MNKIHVGIIITLIFFHTTASATEISDSFICYSDRKVETPSANEEDRWPWQNRDIPVVFNYEKKKLIISAKEILTLDILQVGKHYTNESGENAVDMQAIDHLGRKVTCTFVPGKKKRVDPDTLIVRYCNVCLVYRLVRVNKT